MTTPQPVEVMEADREAAVKLYRSRNFESLPRILGSANRLAQAFAAHRQSTASPLLAEIERLKEALAPFALVADEYERWQKKGSTTEEHSVRFGYGRARFGLPEFRRARSLLASLPDTPHTDKEGLGDEG